MTFPTKADIEFFVKHRSIFWPIWEQEPGDFFEDGLGRVRTVPSDWDGPTWERLGRHNWLPRQGQHQEMLEERGYYWDVGSNFGEVPYYAMTYHWSDENLHYDKTEHLGPTPSIALGKCLLEVLGKEGDMPKELLKEITKGQRP